MTMSQAVALAARATAIPAGRLHAVAQAIAPTGARNHRKATRPVVHPRPPRSEQERRDAARLAANLDATAAARAVLIRTIQMLT